MSASDTTMPLAPWLNADGNPLSVVPLPGLRSDVIQGLECSYPGILTPRMKELLSSSCGLAGTELGSIDFTGSWFLEEPYAVFRPALTLAIDDAERRWIAEVGSKELPGPIWCVFPKPEVAVYVSDDLATFLAELRERTCRGEMDRWIQDLTAQAGAVWSRRHTIALRPHEACHSEREIRGWIMTLPPDAYIYDLRTPSPARGWPYGVAGHSGQHYRCGRELIFAVAGLPAEGWRSSHPGSRRVRDAFATTNGAAPFAIGAARGRYRHHGAPSRAPWNSKRRTAYRGTTPLDRGSVLKAPETRSCG